MYDLGVVVLNYNNYVDTETCVDGLIGQKDIRLLIALVDNGSSNDSYAYLFRKYSEYSNVILLKSDINMGYARGNNLGISYLRKHNIHRIFVCNSDIAFPSIYSMNQFCNGYEPGVGLLNPIIRNKTGELDQRVGYMKKYLCLRIFRRMVCDLLGITLKDKGGSSTGSVEQNKGITGIQTDRYLLAGSAYILTEDFFSCYNGLFYKTFLYAEEIATILLLHKAGLKTKVVDCDPVIHTGGASTPKEIKTLTPTRKKIVRNSELRILQLLFTPRYIAKKKY